MAGAQCPRCGDPLEPNQRLCSGCGAKTSSASGSSLRTSTILSLLLGSVILAAVVLSWVGQRGADAADEALANQRLALAAARVQQATKSVQSAVAELAQPEELDSPESRVASFRTFRERLKEAEDASDELASEKGTQAVMDGETAKYREAAAAAAAIDDQIAELEQGVDHGLGSANYGLLLAERDRKLLDLSIAWGNVTASDARLYREVLKKQSARMLAGLGRKQRSFKAEQERQEREAKKEEAKQETDEDTRTTEAAPQARVDCDDIERQIDGLKEGCAQANEKFFKCDDQFSDSDLRASCKMMFSGQIVQNQNALENLFSISSQCGISRRLGDCE